MTTVFAYVKVDILQQIVPERNMISCLTGVTKESISRPTPNLVRPHAWHVKTGSISQTKATLEAMSHAVTISEHSVQIALWLERNQRHPMNFNVNLVLDFFVRLHQLQADLRHLDLQTPAANV